MSGITLRRIRTGLVVAAAVLAGGACADREPTGPALTAANGAANESGGERAATFRIYDDCDPASFNAVLGPGTCVGSGGTTFQEFIATLQATGTEPAWRFSPTQRAVSEEMEILAVNLGGEEHTFTPVREFGGGVVPILNTLTGNPVEAPECAALEDEDRIAPGETYELEEDEMILTPVPTPGHRHSEVHDAYMKVQCCIHPWMRSTIRVEQHG